jgi:hypothetical protein
MSFFPCRWEFPDLDCPCDQQQRSNGLFDNLSVTRSRKQGLQGVREQPLKSSHNGPLGQIGNRPMKTLISFILSFAVENIGPDSDGRGFTQDDVVEFATLLGINFDEIESVPVLRRIAREDLYMVRQATLALQDYITETAIPDLEARMASEAAPLLAKLAALEAEQEATKQALRDAGIVKRGRPSKS